MRKRTKHSAGYIWSESGKLEHIDIAERILGRPLPVGAEVHHVNHVRSDNRNCNLVICPDKAYHHLLHLRERALDGCGDPNKRKCIYCKKWDETSNMARRDKGQKGIEWRHRACHAANQLARKHRSLKNLSPDGVIA